MYPTTAEMQMLVSGHTVQAKRAICCIYVAKSGRRYEVQHSHCICQRQVTFSCHHCGLGRSPPLAQSPALMPQGRARKRSALAVAGRGAQEAVPKVRWVRARMRETLAGTSVDSRAGCRQHGIRFGVKFLGFSRGLLQFPVTLWQEPIHSGVSLFWRVDFLFRSETSQGIDVCVWFSRVPALQRTSRVR